MRVAILVPTLGRPAALRPLAENIAAVTPVGAFTLLFILDHDDHASRDEAYRTLGGGTFCDGTYPRKINHGYQVTGCQLVLPTADDVVFHGGWYEHALAAFDDPAVQVVGSRDLTPATESGEHATMPILRRSYCEDPGAAWGERNTVFHEGYHHNYVETETWQLALARGVARFVPESVIEHRHPCWGTRGEDETDRKGNLANVDQDRELFHRRQRRWERAAAA